MSQQWVFNRLTDEAKNDGAVCLDGSAPVYYFRPGQSFSSNKWFIFYEGGGWCTTNSAYVSSTFDSCAHRAGSYLGTTQWDGFAPYHKDDNYFSTDPVRNPAMASWNMVYIRYCDGSSFTSNREGTFTQDGKTMYFRGMRIRQAVADHLFATRNLGAAIEVVIGGCSAGGLAANIAIDWWAQRLPNVWRLTALLDSSYFLHHEQPGCYYVSGIRELVSTMNSTGALNTDCVNAHPGNEYLCFFSPTMNQYVKSDLFALQPKFDAWQLDNQACLDQEDLPARNQYGALWMTVFQNTFIWNHKNRGAFVSACFYHCWKYGDLYLNGITNSVAFKQWYDAHWPGQPASVNDYWIDNTNYVCWNCCFPPPPGPSPTTTTTTRNPSKNPTLKPTGKPTTKPTGNPSGMPSGVPSHPPTRNPTVFCVTGVLVNPQPYLVGGNPHTTAIGMSGQTSPMVRQNDFVMGFVLGVLSIVGFLVMCFCVVFCVRKRRTMRSEVLLANESDAENGDGYSTFS